MATEYELKFKASPHVLAVAEIAFPGDWIKIQMETAYFDTPSGNLSQRRYTLRRRLENGASICTLKTPAGNARGEWETECESIEDAIPKLLAMGCPEDLAQLTQESLVHICGAKFTRLAKTLVLKNCTVELALDQGQLTGGEKTQTLCELEVELKSGSMAACNAFAQELAARFGLIPEENSKFSRALALYKGE